MFARKAMDRLVTWKNQVSHRGLLVAGARQVGKTTLIRQFASEHYQNVVEINFFEQPEAVETIGAARNTADLLLRISAVSNKEISADGTLIFFDEIQVYADILTWVKFLEERTDIDVVFSGSLLGIDAFNIRSWPVGYLEVFELFPLDFEEFCEATDTPRSVIGAAREAFEQRSEVPDFIHSRLMDAYSKYLLVGGMPEAVKAYAETSDLPGVRRIQSAIIDLYRFDMTKYVADKMGARRIKAVYDSIPSQLDRENKRFRFAGLGEETRFVHLETAFDWLESAGVALPAYRVNEPVYPLALHETRSAFKLFMNDVGLLMSRLAPQASLDVLNHKPGINLGSVFENAVAQELKARGFGLCYYNSPKRGEVDFVVDRDSDGSVFLVEVKSGKDYKRHRALRNLVAVRDYSFYGAYVLCGGNLEVVGDITYLPVYMAGFIGA